MSFTVVAALREVCRKLHEGEMVYPIGTTTTIGNANKLTLIDAALADPGADTAYLGRPFVRIDALVAGGPASGEIAVAALGGLTVATGEVTFAPTLTQQVKTATDYSLWKLFHPRQALAILQEIVSTMLREVWIPVSALAQPEMAVQDADMEDPGVTAWAQTATTLTKETGAANVRRGSQSLKCVTTNAVNSVKNNSPLLVSFNEQWTIAAAVKCASGTTVTMTVLDVTNANAVIGSAASTSQEGFAEIIANGEVITIPTGCREIAVKFSAGNAATYYIDNVWAFSRTRQIFELPSFVNDPNDVLGVGYFERGRNLVGTFAFTMDEGQFRPWPFKTLVEEGGAHPFRLQFTGGLIRRPLWVKVGRPFTQPALDTDSVTADQDLVVDMVLARIYAAKLRDAETEGDDTGARTWARELVTVTGRIHAKDATGRNQPKVEVYFPRMRLNRGRRHGG